MSDTGNLFDEPDPKTLARRTDPVESKQAAAQIVPELEGLRRRTYQMVKLYPGRIARELSELAGDTDFRIIGRRLGEVEKLGLIRRGESRACKHTGRRCATWWAV